MKQKMNFFKQYWYSIVNPQKYQEMSLLGGGRMFLYILLLSVVMTIVTLTPFVYWYYSHGGAMNFMDQIIPDFRYEDGSLDLDFTYDALYEFDEIEDVFEDIVDDSWDEDSTLEILPYYFYIMNNVDRDSSYSSSREIQLLMRELEDKTFYLYLDTNLQSVEDFTDFNKLAEIVGRADDYYIVTKNNFAYFSDSDLRTGTINNAIEYTDYYYTDVFYEDFSKDDLMDIIAQILPYFYVFFIFVFIFMIIMLVISYFIAGLLFSLAALIINAVLKKNLSYGSLFKISIYAQTASIILVNINSAMGGFIPVRLFRPISYIITLVYIALAVYFAKQQQNQYRAYAQQTPYNGNVPPYNNMPPYNNNAPYNNNMPPYNNNNSPYNNNNAPYNNNSPYNNNNAPYNNNSPYNNNNAPYNNNSPYNNNNAPYNNNSPYNNNNAPYNNNSPYNNNNAPDSENNHTESTQDNNSTPSDQ